MILSELIKLTHHHLFCPSCYKLSLFLLVIPSCNNTVRHPQYTNAVHTHNPIHVFTATHHTRVVSVGDEKMLLSEHFLAGYLPYGPLECGRGQFSNCTQNNTSQYRLESLKNDEEGFRRNKRSSHRFEDHECTKEQHCNQCLVSVQFPCVPPVFSRADFVCCSAALVWSIHGDPGA